MTRYLLCMLFACSACFSRAQESPEKKLEARLAACFAKLQFFGLNNNFDSVGLQSQQLSTLFLRELKAMPATLRYPFRTLQDSSHCSIVSAADSLFRIYSWDTWTGGTMHFFKTIFQYKSGKRIITVPGKQLEDDPGGYYSELFTLHTEKQTYYLAIRNSIYSNAEASQSIKVFSIDKGQLNDTVKIIRANGHLLNEINVSYDFFSVVDRPERPVRLIKYDDQYIRIYIPIVLEKGKVSKRFLVYEFTGLYFERLKTEKEKGKK